MRYGSIGGLEYEVPQFWGFIVTVFVSLKT